MSIVNLYKDFAPKIVETDYFTKKPARARVKGRPKNVPYSWTRIGDDGGVTPLASAELAFGHTLGDLSNIFFKKTLELFHIDAKDIPFAGVFHKLVMVR